MISTKQHLRRLSFAATALLLGVTATLPALLSTQNVFAAQLTTRSIKLDSSAPSATTKYTVTFTTSASTKGIIIDFCGDSPIIGSDCDTTSNATTGLPGFDASGASLSSGLAGWTVAATTTQVKLTNATGVSAGAVTFELSGIKNMNVARTFYARAYTYASATPNWTSVTNVGSDQDYGGFALSTASVVSITAKIMETLTFCVSQASPGAKCAGITTPSVNLGSGSPKTIDANAVYDNSADETTYTQLSTNALTGVSVRMKTDNTCTGLSSDGGASCGIPGIAAKGSITAGTANFGLRVSAGTGGTGSVDPTAGKYDGTGSTYYMGSAVSDPYGDIIEASTGPCANVNNQLVFGVTAGITTPAGIYTANLNLIATGTF